jgi:lysylphosphatidylglycerol synthetase-like protein (DUF2156 family)
MDAALFIDHPSGFLACTERNRRFDVAGMRGFISYREQGRYRVALGGVHSTDEAGGALLDAFLSDTRAAGGKALFVQVPARQVRLFESRGATVNRLGSTFALRLAGYALKGTPKIALRNKIHRAERSGLRALELGRDCPASAPLREALASISQAWLRDKGGKELAFMVGVASDGHDSLRRTFIALDERGEAVAFITYVPAWGRRAGYLHDLSRRRPDAAPGAMELINAFAIRRFQEEGVEFLHFGFTPFVMTGVEPASASGIISRVSALLYEYGRAIYPAKSQAAYKRKWGADLVEPEYLAGFPLSSGGLFALLRLTRAL